MATFRALGGGIVGGGILPASSWTDAVNKAKSYIVVVSSGGYVFTTLIPKEELSTTQKQFGNGASYAGGSVASPNYYFVLLQATTTNISQTFYTNGIPNASATMTFYYDI